jgi:hypothetical protein
MLLSLNSMTVDAVCEKLRHIEGLDQSMVPQYCATIKKVMPTFTSCLETGLRYRGQMGVLQGAFLMSCSNGAGLLM